MGSINQLPGIGGSALAPTSSAIGGNPSGAPPQVQNWMPNMNGGGMGMPPSGIMPPTPPTPGQPSIMPGAAQTGSTGGGPMGGMLGSK